MASSEHTIRIKADVDLAGPMAAELRRIGQEFIAAADRLDEGIEKPKKSVSRFKSAEEMRATLKPGDQVRIIKGKMFSSLPPEHRKHLGHTGTLLEDDGSERVCLKVECRETECRGTFHWFAWDEVKKPARPFKVGDRVYLREGHFLFRGDPEDPKRDECIVIEDDGSSCPWKLVRAHPTTRETIPQFWAATENIRLKEDHG